MLSRLLPALIATVAFVGLLGAAGCGMTGTTKGTTGGGSSGGGAPGGDVSPGVLTPGSSSVSFGNVTVGSPTSQPVLLTNTGSSNITISSVSVAGGGLSVSGGSNVTLTANQSVTIYVNFDPTGPGAVNGELTVSSNASNSSLQIGVTGTGIAQAAQHTVSLSWQPSTSVVVGYYVYRGPASNNLSKLTGAIDMLTTYSDSSVAGGQTYVYAVTSVDSQNVESTKSTPITVTIPNN